MDYVTEVSDMANKLRILCIEMTNSARSGHPTSCSTVAEIMAVLFFGVMKLELKHPLHKSSDRFLLSKGHAAPMLYAVWCKVGHLSVEQLMNFRSIYNGLEAFPTPRMDFVDVATGSPGVGLAMGCGMAYVGIRIDKASYRIYVLLGESDMGHGSTWEALDFASTNGLSNLCAIVDFNRMDTGSDVNAHVNALKHKVEHFGFHTILVDGHDITELRNAFDAATHTKNKPTAILAKTVKGKNFLELESLESWQGKFIGENSPSIIEHLESLIRNMGDTKLSVSAIRDDAPSAVLKNMKLDENPSYSEQEKTSTSDACENAAVKLIKSSDRVVIVDCLRNKKFQDKIIVENRNQYIECSNAEQCMIGVGIGAMARERVVAIAWGQGAFLTKTFDQIRLGAISKSNLNIVGTDCGASVGEDGPCQMGLEDIAMLRSIPGSTIFYPSDAISAERALELAVNTKGICYIRTARPELEILYKPNHAFKVGSAHVVKKTKEDKVLVIAAGVTLHNAIAAHNFLKDNGVGIRVMDLFTVKPLDKKSIEKNAEECGHKVIIVEDHYVEGGICDAIAHAVNTKNWHTRFLAINEMPKSGPADVVLETCGLSHRAIVDAVYEFK